MFTGNTNNEKCNTYGLEATTIPWHVKVQHIKGIANILADSVSRLRAVGLYYDLDFQNSQSELGMTFEPSLPYRASNSYTYSSTQIFIKPDIETLAQNYTVTKIHQPKLSLDNASPKDVPCLEHKLMSLHELTSEK